MLDALAMPALALLVISFVVYVWLAWLKDKKNRALNVPGETESEDPPSAHD